MKNRKIRKFLWKNPVTATILIALVLAISLSFIFIINFNMATGLPIIEIVTIIPGQMLFAFIFITFPAMLCILNFVGLFIQRFWAKNWRMEIITVLYGAFCTFMWGTIVTQIDDKDWWEAVYPYQKHLPVWSGGITTFLFMCLVAIAGYFILRFKKTENTPPLLFVLGISGLYIGSFLCVIWCIQVFKVDFMLCVLPVNCVMIALKVIDQKIYEWKKYRKKQDKKEYKAGFFGLCEKLLENSKLWGILGLLFAVPLFGIILCILILFGQQPDYIIKMWTETADWALSQQIPPQCLEYDGHYLCTVAAGGHKKIVKPLRYGRRYNNYIVVNRQLCIANAFEQIIEEKAPKFHKVIRYIYDKYGFPLAKLIKSKFAADLVYIIMKPLEWVFLAVIYLCDKKPENRIAVQYLPKETLNEKH